MTRSPTFSPAAETTTPPQTSDLAAPRLSTPGPTSPASSWLHNHAYCRASLSPLFFPSIVRCQVDVPVSLFEPHADIIVKGARDVQYGHKLNLATGQSGLILDIVVETGNPADAERFLPMIERQIARCGVPRQVAADGGYASQANLTAAKARGVNDVAFHKKRGLAVEDMVKSRWVYRKLRNFRAGIEAGISCLKRAYGLARCTWRGLDHFKTYIWSAVVAHNLVLLARLKPA